MRKVIGLVAAVAVIGGGTAVALASHRGPTRAALPTAREGRLQVIAFTDARPTAPARGSLSAHLSSLTAISPAWLSLGPNGTISYRDTDAFSRGLTGRGAGLLPVLRDPERRIASILRRTSLRKRTAFRLAVMLRTLGAQGIVLDLGQVPASDRLLLPALLRDLRDELPPSSRILIVVPPIHDRASQRAAAGYDLRDLARPATLVLRAWGGKHATQGPHPIASLGWYRQTLRYTLAHAPRSKVIVALPTWGAAWTSHGVIRRTQAQLFRLATPAALQQAAGARVEQAGSTAWVESDRSLQLKLEVARAAHVAGVALWVRGGESSGVWREPLLAAPKGSPSQ
jgi:spore germination protein YaaH